MVCVCVVCVCVCVCTGRGGGVPNRTRPVLQRISALVCDKQPAESSACDGVTVCLIVQGVYGEPVLQGGGGKGRQYLPGPPVHQGEVCLLPGGGSVGTWVLPLP